MTSGSPVPPARLRAAIGVAALAVPFAALAPLIGSVSPAMPPAYPSWLVLALVSALPPVLAVIWTMRGDHGGAAGILRAAGMLAPGLLLLDLQVLADPLSVARPELFVPTTLVDFTAGSGLHLLLLSRVLVIAAALLAAGEQATEARDTARARPGLMFSALTLAGLVALPLFVPPFLSADPYLPVRVLTESPALLVVGTLALAGSMLFAAAYFTGAAVPELARGGLVGLIAAVAGVVLVPVVSALATPGLSLGLFQQAGLVATALALVTLGVLAWVAGRRDNLTFEVGELPGHRKLEVAAGALAAAAGVFAVVASALPIARLASGEVQSVGSARMLVPAGFALLALGLLLLFKDTSTAARPALAVAWVVLPATGMEVLDTAFSQVVGIRAAALAAALVIIAMICAAVAGLLCLLAGGREREDTVDLSEIGTDRPVLAPAALAALLAFGAYLFPVVVNPDFPAAGLLGSFRTETWGLLLSAAAVIGAALLAPRSRPPRAAALLGGAALVLALRVAELPVRGGGSAGLGLFLGLGGLAALLAGVGVAWSRRSSANRLAE